MIAGDHPGRNLSAINSIDGVDSINRAFYEQFQYPHPSNLFESVQPSDFWSVALCQEIGDWECSLFSGAKPRIWVAGCGTNQAVITALKFPNCEVIGSDLSEASLATAKQTADDLRVTNLILKQESLNAVSYYSEFDYILCTGVIHHNAEPELTLRHLKNALKKNGIIELMVYNSFHSIVPSAVQSAVQLLNDKPSENQFQSQARTASLIIQEMGWDQIPAGPMTVVSKEASQAQLADLLIQPVWHSYSVAGLEAMCQRVGLDFVAPCLNQFDAVAGNVGWELNFQNPDLRELYNKLSQSKQWQLTNLLLREKSPMIWFYLQQKESTRPIKTQRQIFFDFLESEASPSRAVKTVWSRNSGGSFTRRDNIPARLSPWNSEATLLLSHVRKGTQMRSAFERSGLKAEFAEMNRLRLYLASSVFPILRLSPFCQGQ